jgi:hypothetical protein
MADDRVTWIDSGSTSHKLDDILDSPSNKLLVLQGRVGFGPPAYERVEQTIPLQDGARLKSINAAPADMLLPVLIKCATESDLYDQMGTMLGWFDPRSADGQLQVATPNGHTRVRKCRYVTGLEEDDSTSNRGPGWRQVVFAFRAVEPYWRDTSDQTYDFGSATTTHTLVNSGDVESWPVWTLHGIFTAVTLLNNTTGDTVTITKTLTSTQIITVDTNPFVKSVKREDGSNQFSSITSTPPSLWSLAPGNNSVTVTITGSSTNCDVAVAYRQRWRTL